MNIKIVAIAISAAGLMSRVDSALAAMPRVHSAAASESATSRMIHRYFGYLQGRSGTTLTLRLRNNAMLTVDASAAFAAGQVSAPLFAGKATVVQGTIAANGVFHATSVTRTAPDPTHWDIDR